MPPPPSGYLGGPPHADRSPHHHRVLTPLCGVVVGGATNLSPFDELWVAFDQILAWCARIRAEYGRVLGVNQNWIGPDGMSDMYSRSACCVGVVLSLPLCKVMVCCCSLLASVSGGRSGGRSGEGAVVRRVWQHEVGVVGPLSTARACRFAPSSQSGCGVFKARLCSPRPVSSIAGDGRRSSAGVDLASLGAVGLAPWPTAWARRPRRRH